MASPTVGNTVTLKALVDKGSNKVIFIEPDNDFVDVLFSFLTIPLGTIFKHGCKHTIPVEIGCMNNLYSSVEKIDVQFFRSNACRDMLLLPCNVAESHCKNLKLKILNGEPPRYFYSTDCCYIDCPKILGYHADIRCPRCSRGNLSEIRLSVDDSQVGGAFVRGQPRFIITDNLQVILPLSEDISLFTKLGVTDTKTTEELTFSIGVEEVLNLLMSSFVSKTPLTETLLKHEPMPNLVDVYTNQGICVESQMFDDVIKEEEKNISVKLIVSKSKKIVCYAEAREDLVNLLFSFLTLPIGFILEKLRENSWKGCVDQLYKSVRNIDEQYLKSNYHKEMLVSPKLVPGFCYDNPLLGTEEASFYYVDRKLTTDRSRIPSHISAESVKFKVIDPKSHDDKDKSAQGFLKGPAIFTITDNLVVRPLSPIFEMSVLQELKVAFNDIEHQIVHVGKKEALRLLVASFVGDSALTNAFLKELREPKQEH